MERISGTVRLDANLNNVSFLSIKSLFSILAGDIRPFMSVAQR